MIRVTLRGEVPSKVVDSALALNIRTKWDVRGLVRATVCGLSGGPKEVWIKVADFRKDCSYQWMGWNKSWG